MKIFIDEAGSFARAPNRPWSVSCVGALVVPDEGYADLLVVIPRLKQRWGLGEAEIKGRSLTEDQARQLITLLAGYDVVFGLHAVDMALEVETFIDLHRKAQAHEVTRRVSPDFHPNLVAQLQEFRSTIESLPDNLYVQGTLTWGLVHDTLRNALLYYVQRRPRELGSFDWILDAKDKLQTRYEAMWNSLVLPAMQAQSFKEPLIMLRGADYSHFERFETRLEEIPQHLVEPLGHRGPETFVDVKEVLRHRTFADSASSVGLQLVDALTSISRRAMMGNLGAHGWDRLGSLVVSSERDRNAIHVVTLAPRGVAITPHREAPYLRVITHLDRTAKPMLKSGRLASSDGTRGTSVGQHERLTSTD